MNGKDQSNRLVVPTAAGGSTTPLDLEQRRSAFDKRSRSQPIILNRSSLQSRSKTNSCVSAIVESVSSAAISSLNGLSSRPGTTQRHWQAIESQTACGGAEPRQSSSSFWKHLPLRARQSCPVDQVTKPNVDQLLAFPDRYNAENVAASDRLLQPVPEMTFHAALTNSSEVDGQTEVTIICEKNSNKSPSSSNHLQERNSFNSSTGGGCRLISGGSSLTMGELLGE